jgi:enamine deaminase RidA (YjgF/YER057c/UK114 family)
MTERIDPITVKSRPYYAHAVARQGTPVFLTGQVAWDEDGKVLGVGDIEAQIEQVWRNIRSVVDEAGAEIGDIVKLTTYATDRAFIPALHAERAKHFTPGGFPASTFIQVLGLAEPDLLVEVEAVLMLPDDHPVFLESEEGNRC